MITAEQLTDFTKFYTPLVSDTLDRLGIKGCVMDRSIQAFNHDPHLKICGTAFPCRVVPTAENVEINTLLAMIDAIPSHSIVVVAADADIDAALWGGLMSTGALRRGAVAAVVNGGVRDMEQIAGLGFPVFGAYRCVKDIRTRGFMAEYNITVQCGGTTVAPDDIIFADANGVVVIPQKHFATVEKELLSAATEERSTMQGLAKGESAQKLYETYKRF